MAHYLLLACLAVADGGDAVMLKEIGVTLPRSVANLQFTQRRNFPQRALGYSVSYANRLCAATLIVYDLDEKGIPDGKASAAVAGQMKNALADMKTAEARGFYANVRRMEGKLPLPKAVTDTFAAAGFTFDVKGGACKSYVLIVGRNGHFFKVRITQYVVDGRTNDADVNAFLLALVKELRGRGGKEAGEKGARPD